MGKYIKIEDAIETAINGCASWDGGYSPSMDVPIKAEFEAVDGKYIDLVRCKDCKHYRKIKDHSGICVVLAREEQMPEDYFCADGKPKGGIED